jgi:hypothetical protein
MSWIFSSRVGLALWLGVRWGPARLDLLLFPRASSVHERAPFSREADDAGICRRRQSLAHADAHMQGKEGSHADSCRQAQIAGERCKRSVLENGARRRDPRLGRAPRVEGSLGGRAVTQAGRHCQAGREETRGCAVARHACRRRGAGRQAGVSARNGAARMRPCRRRRPRGGWWWVARRQAAQHSAPNDWHGFFFFFCRPRFPRLRAVLAVARTARACLPRSGVLLRSGEARGSVLYGTSTRRASTDSAAHTNGSAATVSALQVPR